jgi:hypothetical protein
MYNYKMKNFFLKAKIPLTITCGIAKLGFHNTRNALRIPETFRLCTIIEI